MIKILFLILILTGCKTTMAADWDAIDESTISKIEFLEQIDERTRNLFTHDFASDTNIPLGAWRYSDSARSMQWYNGGGWTSNTDKEQRRKLATDSVLNFATFTSVGMYPESLNLDANSIYEIDGLVVASPATSVARTIRVRFNATNTDIWGASFLGIANSGTSYYDYISNYLSFTTAAIADAKTIMKFHGTIETTGSAGTLTMLVDTLGYDINFRVGTMIRARRLANADDE